MGAFVSSFVGDGPTMHGAPLSKMSNFWGPENRQGKAWLFMGGRGHENNGGHFALFLDIAGTSEYGEPGGEDVLPERFSGILIHLGLLENDDGTRLRVSTPLIHYFDKEQGFFDAHWCDKILLLNPKLLNAKNAVSPKVWAEEIQSTALDCFNEMSLREAREDDSDAHFQSLANHELDKAGWKYKVDFSTPKELWAKRWDKDLNSHTYAAKLTTKLGLEWPQNLPVVPEYSHWVLDSILSAPSNKTIKTAVEAE